MMDHLLDVGGHYQNEIGSYEVLEIDGDRMHIRFEDGTEQTVKVEIQARIWQRIRDEASPSPQSYKSSHKSKAIQPVIDLVEEVLLTNYKAPYPPDITDQVCGAIEVNPEWMERYSSLAKEFESEGQSGEATVNQAIGFHVGDITGMVTVRSGVEAKSGLIKTYSELAYPDSASID